MTSFAKLICLLGLVACAREFRPTLEPPPDLRANDYGSVLRTWTRKHESFSGVEHKMTARATMITPMLRAAFAKRFPEVYGYGGQITRDELRELPGNEPDPSLTFVVAIYVPSFRWQDLDKPNSIWRVTLQRSANEQAPPDLTVDATRIEKVKRDENLNTIFHYLEPFDVVYMVRFPVTLRANERAYVRMRIASSFSESILGWEIQP